MAQTYLSSDVIKKIKGFNRLKLTEKQHMLIDQLISDENLKTCYKMYGLCKTCNQPHTGYDWCQLCNAKYFRQDFKNWTSGNREIDEFIQKVQLRAKTKNEVIEWIDYDKFENIEYLAKGGFGITYKANWKKGYIIYRDTVKDWWERSESILVALKCLHNSQNITTEFLKKIESQIKMNNTFFTIYCYGITKDPKTKNFMLVMEYAENGNLRTNLDKSFNSMNWWNKLYILEEIASGLKDIHNNGLIHHDFHCGNILNNIMMSNCIADLGLCQPANQNDKKQIYGVLPYVAPEVLREKEYTQASDIYGFGIIAHEVITGLPPYYDLGHGEFLAIRICHGLRPISDYQSPQSIINIIEQCWDADPLKRPKANQLYNLLYNLRCETTNTNSTIYREIKESDKFNKRMLSSTTASLVSSPTDSKHPKDVDRFYTQWPPSNTLREALSYTKHPQAVYTSRLLDFENLPEPQNADDDSFGTEISNLGVGLTKLKIDIKR